MSFAGRQREGRKGEREEQEQQEQIELRIEAVLGGLGAAEPAAGFQERLVGALPGEAVRGEAVPAGRWALGKLRGRAVWGGRLGVPPLGGAVAVCGVLVVALVLVAKFGVARRPQQRAKSSARAEFVASGPALRRALEAGAGTSFSSVAVVRDRVGATRPGEAARARGLERRGGAASAVARPAEEEQAAVDLQTASFPAPPLPPTAQERRVRLMLRRGERKDLAQLDPERSALFAEQEQVALHAFFEPPRPQVETVTQVSQGDSQ